MFGLAGYDNLLQDFIYGRDHAADSRIEVDWAPSIHREPNIVDHLAVAQLNS
jgi:hypothetical protein